MLRFRSITTSSRRGFTLLEMTIAVAILSVMLAAIFGLFFGNRKSQGQAVTQSMMKVEGQTLLKQLYVELGQLKRILASADSAPAEQDIGRSYYNQLEIPVGTVTKMPDQNVRFPRVSPNSKFNVLGTEPGQMNPTWFGNALIFVSREKLVPITTADVQIKVGGGGLLRVLDPDKPFRLNTYRFVAYFLDERLRKADEAPINGLNHTYGLTRYESHPYVEKNELQGFFGLVPDPLDRVAVWEDLKTNHGVRAAWDINEVEAPKAFFTLDLAGNLVETPTLIAPRKVKRALNLDMSPYAKGFMAFNTTDGTFRLPDLNDKAGLDVPRFGEEQMIVPYGFEVGLTGTNSGRAILIRLAMAARLNQGGHMYGQSQQTIIHAVDN